MKGLDDQMAGNDYVIAPMIAIIVLIAIVVVAFLDIHIRRHDLT